MSEERDDWEAGAPRRRVSTHRGIERLRQLADFVSEPRRMSELVTLTGWSRSTVHRNLKLLPALGYQLTTKEGRYEVVGHSRPGKSTDAFLERLTRLESKTEAVLRELREIRQELPVSELERD